MKITVDLTIQEIDAIRCEDFLSCGQCTNIHTNIHTNCEKTAIEAKKKIINAYEQAKTAMPDGEDETRL